MQVLGLAKSRRRQTPGSGIRVVSARLPIGSAQAGTPNPRERPGRGHDGHGEGGDRRSDGTDRHSSGSGEGLWPFV